MKVVRLCANQFENLGKQTDSLVAGRIIVADALDRFAAILNRPQNKGSEYPDVEMPEQDTIRRVGNFLDKITSNNYIFESEKLQSVLDENRDIEQ